MLKKVPCNPKIRVITNKMIFAVINENITGKSERLLWGKQFKTPDIEIEYSTIKAA